MYGKKFGQEQEYINPSVLILITTDGLIQRKLLGCFLIDGKLRCRRNNISLELSINIVEYLVKKKGPSQGPFPVN